ncbi:MAG TPA: ATP-dependent DNA helicase [Thermoleophilaceae bacterium]|nr:ATP-dependent DNA helicase [Thermoleophilaceae bacterium]
MPASLDGLTEAQRAAVSKPPGPVLVAGGPGTGKTLVLQRRAGWLVEQGEAADGVLVLSASKPASDSMRIALETLIDAPYGELAAETFRSFCARLLRDEALEAGLDPGFAAVAPADRLDLLLERIDDLPLRRHEIRGNPAPLIGSFVSRIDRLKEEMISADEYRRYAETLSHEARTDADRAEADRELEFARVYLAHDRLLASRDALDGGDLVGHAFGLLHEKPHVRRRTAERFPHVLVDDVTRLSFAEGALLRLLGQDHSRLTAAGDEGPALDDLARDFSGAEVVRLEHSHRSGRRILQAARAISADGRRLAGPPGGKVRFWRGRTARAEAQATAAEVERLLTRGTPADAIAVLVPDIADDGRTVGSALEERAAPFRLTGADAYFQRAEVRDALAWLRLLADPADAGAVVRALSRPPVGLRSVDIARLTQLGRRRKLDMVSAVAVACEGPQLSPEGRERAQQFLKLYRAASRAFETMRPDAFLHRLIERIGLRRRQVFAAQADTVERLVNIAKLSDLAGAYLRREPQATPRDLARYLAAVAAAGLPEEEAVPHDAPNAVRVMAIDAAAGHEFDHVFVLGLAASRLPGPPRPDHSAVPDALHRDSRPGEGDRAREVLHTAITRARRGVVLSWRESEGRPSPLYEKARGALSADEEAFEEELFGPAEGLHSTFRMMRDELLDTVSRVGGRLSEMRLDTYLDVSQAVTRYLELLKVAALLERSKQGQPIADALPEVNDLLLQVATAEQRELFSGSALDEWLRDVEREKRRRSDLLAANGGEPSLESFIPRRGEGLMLSASDIETYRLCPLKYKFARVFRIPEEPTINQRFGIVIHQVLERWHTTGAGTLEDLMSLFEVCWRRNGFGGGADDLQFREKAVAALTRYWELDRARESEPVWFERSFSFKLGPHILRGRVDRIDRLPDGSYELIDYKTGRAKTERELANDVQLSLYQMGARDSWRLETSAQSYYYVLDNRKVPVAHSDEELERVRGTVAEVGEGIMGQEFEPQPSQEICPFCDYRIICPAAEK